MDTKIDPLASELEATPASRGEPASVPESPSAPPLRPELLSRLDRIAAYRAASLVKRNPLHASVGSTNAGLMCINAYLEDTLVQALAAGPSSPEHLQKLQPTIDTYLRVTRQIDRFTQLELKGKSRRSSSLDGAHRAKIM
ncbi:MAG TPA: hypothetical protein VG125_26270 [Pirellulales bacterium]|jgi:hypothetical protein|nr:hypothetical protein [Pirellulales bacterium]